MTDLKDKLQAQADLRQQEQERVRIVATPNEVITTRLVSGVEMKMKQEGVRWTLSARKAR